MSSIRVRLFLVGSIVGVSLAAAMTPSVAANGPGSRPAPTCPSFSSTDFHKPTTIDNRHFPLAPRTRFTYEGNVKKVPVLDVVYVTHNTVTIDGVKTVEVRDQVYESES